jgi:NADPH:quinone reductase-like Zn-dependent oxidoreductase
MKAVVLQGFGGVEQLRYDDVEKPRLKPGEVLVKVVAAGINPADIKTRRGQMGVKFTPQPRMILGYDLAGEVVDPGDGADGFEPGDRVMGVVGRAYAEFAAAPAKVLTKIPDGIETENAAALPLALTTGAQLVEIGVRPIAGETLLVTGALGSVGRTAVYVARKHGMKVIAGVRAKRREEALGLGVEQAIALDQEESIASLGKVDAIADTVGGSVIEKLLPYIRHGGVLATVLGKPKGAEGGDFEVREVWSSPDPERLHQLAEAVAHGELVIPIAKKLKLSEVREAQTLAERGGIGKVLLLA